MSKHLLTTLLAALLGALLSCSAASARDKYDIVTTTAMVADIARNVAGERAAVYSLIGAGVDPHLYRPTRKDVSRMMRADVVFYNGLNLEGKMGDTLIQIARKKPVHAVSELVAPEHLLTDSVSGHDDPHLWMDPNGWIQATKAVTNALCEFDADAAAEYRANAAAYVAKLESLDKYARKSFASIPKGSRVLVTAHDAFNYMARAYSLEVKGIQGISTESEAGLKYIEELVNLLVSRKIAAVFTETSVSDKNIKSLIDGARARDHAVLIGGELFSDAMGAAGTYEGTYVGMIDHNITIITRALGGEAPPRGLNGKLDH